MKNIYYLCNVNEPTRRDERWIVVEGGMFTRHI